VAVTTTELLRERMTRQGLAERTAGGAPAAARLGVALQAQDHQAPRLGVRARTVDSCEADVVRACGDGRDVVRTWLMRATVHLAPAEDLRWMVGLFGPMIERRFAKRWGELGLTPPTRQAAARAMPELLTGRQLSRHEVVAALARRGIVIDPAGQAPTHLMLYTSAIGLTCRGADRGRETTFALLADWLPQPGPSLVGDAALAELARRYFAAFGPASGADFTSWSGLPSSRAIAAIRDELTPVEIHGRAGWRLGEVEPVSALRLLPAFDNYLIGYRHREGLIDPALRERVYDGGMIHPTVVLDGRILATWRLERSTTAAQVTVAPFGPLSRSTRRAVAEEADDIGRFVGLPVELRYLD
jgi:hypothetical protein